jgi:hypothetical protein
MTPPATGFRPTTFGCILSVVILTSDQRVEGSFGGAVRAQVGQVRAAAFEVSETPLPAANRCPILCPCSLSAKPMPPQSSPSTSKRANCRPPSRRAAAFPASSKTGGRGTALGEFDTIPLKSATGRATAAWSGDGVQPRNTYGFERADRVPRDLHGAGWLRGGTMDKNAYRRSPLGPFD